ncbi:MAG: flavodoxin family protein [Methanothrix sp.]|nr:flavodoxin family protein [Methanothrix sp.]
MKVLAINGSPRMSEGNTAMILNPFLESMREAGAEVELLYARRLSVGPCNGDMSCWFETPGECCQRDDMQVLYPKLREADIIVLATPLYYSGVTGLLKNLMDRMLPVHVFSRRRQRVILVSTCGDWSIRAFDPLLAQMRAAYSMPETGPEYLCALLRPAAEAMRHMAGQRSPLDDVLAAAREAGRQVIMEGRISEDLLGRVSQEIVSEEEYNRAAKEMMERIKKGA